MHSGWIVPFQGGTVGTHSAVASATNLHALGVDDKTIQAILRHSNVGLTQNVYIKSVTESQVNAMDVLGARLGKETSNNLATVGNRHIN
jgi:hypothetical protein